MKIVVLTPFALKPPALRRLWLTLGCLTLNGLALCQTPPPNEPTLSHLGAMGFVSHVQLDYKIEGKTHGFSYPARATMKWNATENAYQASLDVALPLIGNRTQNSQGSLGPNGVEPLTFKDHQRREYWAKLQRGGAITWSEGSSPSAPMEPQTQDALSVYFQLSAWLCGLSEPPPNGKTLTLPIVMAQSLEHWTFKFLSLESISTPYGDVKALHLQRLARSSSDTQTVDLWLAKELAYLPARILIEQGESERVDQWLKAVQW